ncbi:FAD-dependent monooxygenase (plasmid) [Burkholderia gladioli]|uniref:FAD-dependent monooxygenase n=1 Tax=Burkholderia gladioli TaxID=28095 RepID=UPI00193678F5|nr:FAD-dependent monooxygenase [Burkholderia gladioli]QPQ89100.1 FAD-dependent monooxygenase [Burkholderia gladioli]
MSHSELLDVLVVGAGPTGVTLAVDLARRGLSYRLIDKQDGPFMGSRAKGVQPRTLEVLHDLGAVDEILATGSLYPKAGIHIGRLTLPWSMFKTRAPSDAIPYPNTWLIPQNRVEAALRSALSRYGGEVEWGVGFQELRQSADYVECLLNGVGGMETVRARYVVGADGGGSTVRKDLGVPFNGTTDEADRILIVDASVSGLRRDRWHMWPMFKGRFVAACPLPHNDVFQFMIRLAPDEAVPEKDGAVEERLQAVIRSPNIVLQTIHWRSVFRPNIRLAEHYRVHRVLLAGDAAHVHTPAGAQGMNTGIQDAYNLGWKLVQVIAGANETLLDTYEKERQPIASQVLGLSTKKYEGLNSLSPSSLRRGKDEQQLAITYRGGPLARLDALGTRTLSVGDRAPDAVLDGADGNSVRLFDLFRGPHFSLLSWGPRAAAVARLVKWPQRGAQLNRIEIGATGTRGEGRLLDGSNSFRKTYGIQTDMMFLIRPDGYVGHVASVESFEKLIAAINKFTPGSN